MYNDASSPALNGVTFSRNWSVGSGGGMYNGEFSAPVLTQVTFSANSAVSGGGMYNAWVSKPSLGHVTLAANDADYGGGMYNEEFSAPVLTQVTFSANSAGSEGDGIYDAGSGASISNSAFWGNGTDGDVSGTPTVAYSCSAQDLMALGGSNVTLGTDPFAAAPAGGELFLDQGGDCVDHGSDSYAPAGWGALTTDFAGSLDDSPVDAGRHYEPTQPLVLTLAADASELTWSTRDATACSFFGNWDYSFYDVPEADLASGSFTHGRPSGAPLTLVCQGAAGSPAAVRVAVP